MLRALSAVTTLFVFWLLLSGLFTPFLVLAGLGSAVLVVAIGSRMDVVDHEGHPYKLLWPVFFTYWPWLAKEIFFSAWDVTQRILNPRLPISPTMRAFVPTQTSDIGLVIHANSITLTPGTIAIEVEPGHFLVHALTRQGADALEGSEMDRRCSALEDRAP